MSDSFLQLRTAFNTLTPLPDPEWDRLKKIFQNRQVNLNDFVSHPGDEAHELIFVTQGLLRFYYLTADGKESNKAFIVENQFAGPLASAVLGIPIYYGIQALEPTSMLVAPFQAFTELYETSIHLERLGRKFAELLLVRKELRTRSLLEQTATERYQDLLHKSPHLIERVPQYHLASYLGIAEVSLSRLKNNGRILELT
ncbi:MAG: Crp/Fnr family transcriptional regulator [Anaerolineae bacterium]